MADILKIDKKPEIIELMELLMNLSTEEQKVILGFVQGVKLARDIDVKTDVRAV